ncbi:MAG: zinc transporter ZupT [Candidatus Korarchaeota archaeon]|nr:zinc transporter ZupT [Candidatus Korarchaeota archaeon]NIU82227.1 zinc transporter ZupT [Candidatus Thorarchaeota archaeon]NIW12690.1 zinc transporter ZupT [Candidatus Thorarchaeota archaeon]NIW50897.1 zinc transporter ZupT [Candidatus Korarchaeota archaeon]
MDGQIVFAFLLTLFAGLSTGIGALLSYFIKKAKFHYLSFLLGFSAGVMIFVSFMELLTAAIDGIGFLAGNLGFFGGIVGIYLVDKFIPHKHVDTKPDAFHTSEEQQQRLAEAGVLTAVGIAIHNFPEGLAVFAVSLESISLGVPIAIAIAIHNIPEGIAVAIPIYYATGDRKKAFLYSLFSGVAEPIGAAIGFLVLAPFISKAVLNLTLGIVGGIMVFISFDELIPISRDYGGEHVSGLGLFTGMFIIMVSLHLL